MGNLTKCKTCGNEIARSAVTCPHCGARNKMQVGCCSGCLLAIICMVVFTYATSASLSSTDKDRPPEIESQETVVTYTPPAQPKQSSPKVSFDETALVVFSEEYAEKRLKVKTRLKWSGKRKVEKLRPSGNHEGVIYSIERDFSELNAFNVEIKHQARIFMEFHSEKGYRGVGLIVDGKTI